jgi:ribosomal protein S18 acetylase RimI-like enzyme
VRITSTPDVKTGAGRSPADVGTAGVRLRPARTEDEPFLYDLYASTRAEELAQVDWNEAQRTSFLRMQFTAQSRFYQSEYLGAAFQIIEWKGMPVGRLYLHRRPQEIRVMDISLLPEHRGRGIGRGLLEKVLDEAAGLGKSVTIHVETFNRAIRLYERLGFQRVASNGIYHLMEWLPETLPSR